MRAVRDFIGSLFDQPSSRVGVLDNHHENRLFLQNIPTLTTSYASKEALDLLLITAATNPLWEPRDENESTQTVAELLARGANVNAAASDGFTALMIAAKYGHTEIVLALLSRDAVDWQIVQNQLSHPALQNLNKEVSFLLAVILPDEELRNSIITSFNQRNSNRNSIIERLCQRNPDNSIQQENNDILGAGLEAYKNLKDLKSWHVRYLTDSGVDKDEVEILANQRFFDLLNHQDARQEALARNDLVTDLVNKSKSSAIYFVGLAGAQEHLCAVGRLSPEDLHKLTTKITDKSKAENGGIATLEVLSLVATLRKGRTDQTSASPATTMNPGSLAQIVTPQKEGRCVFS
jgi:hypothetical protein